MAVTPGQVPARSSGASRAGKPSSFVKYLVVLAVMPPAIMEILDTAVVNVSLPHIGGSMGASVDEAMWVLTSYLIANAIMVPLGGWLSHRFGRKRLLLSVITGFTISSMLCGLAPTLPLLVFFRIMQGLTGGGLQPLCQATLLQEFPRQQHYKAMTFWAFGAVLAPTFAPTLGGWITDTWSWRWAFFINVPIGVASWMLVSAFIHDEKDVHGEKAAKADVIGIAYLAIGMAALQTVLDKGQQEDWFGSHLIVALSVIAFVFVPLFIFRELRAPNPFVKIRLLKERNFGLGSVIGFLMYSTLFGSILLVPLFMETILGWTAQTAGFWTMARGLGSFTGLLIPWIPGLRRMKESKWVVSVGFAVTGSVFIFWFAHMNMYAGPWDLFWPQFTQGLAATLAFIRIIVIVYSRIDDREKGYAASLFGMVRNIGQSVGVSFVGIFLARRDQANQAAIAGYASRGNAALVHAIGGLQRAFMLHGVDAHRAGQAARAMLYGEMLHQASTRSYLDAFYFFGVVLVAIAPITLLMKKRSND